MNKILENKIALITGASKGIGRSIALKFAKEGAIVYAVDIIPCDFSNEPELPIRTILLDICDFQAVKQAFITIKKESGKLDVLVNNAGIVTYELLSMIDFNKLRSMFEVNVIALIHLMQLASRLMMRQNSGSIINMASMVGVNGAAGQLSYSATKGAVVSVTKSAAKELATSLIRVNAIAPGMVGSERFKKVIEANFKEKIEDIPFGRLAEPEEIANVCLFLASDLSSYITGQVIGVDGGAII